jgi:hypothetical protein
MDFGPIEVSRASVEHDEIAPLSRYPVVAHLEFDGHPFRTGHAKRKSSSAMRRERVSKTILLLDSFWKRQLRDIPLLHRADKDGRPE